MRRDGSCDVTIHHSLTPSDLTLAPTPHHVGGKSPEGYVPAIYLLSQNLRNPAVQAFWQNDLSRLVNLAIPESMTVEEFMKACASPGLPRAAGERKSVARHMAALAGELFTLGLRSQS